MLPLSCRVFGHSKRDEHSATMCYMIAETGDCPFCKAIMHHTRTRNYLYRMMKKHGIARKE
jgi:hypothetical protein